MISSPSRPPGSISRLAFRIEPMPLSRTTAVAARCAPDRDFDVMRVRVLGDIVERFLGDLNTRDPRAW